MSKLPDSYLLIPTFFRPSALFPYFTSMNSTIEILAFGQILDIIGQKTLNVEYTDDTDQLTATLIEKFPSLAKAEYRMAVNMEIIRGNVKLNPGDVVALLPPFSGG